MKTNKTKVKVIDENGDLLFSTNMDNIPRKGDKIGLWINDTWTVVDVEYTVFELLKNDIGTFCNAEVNVILNP